MSRVASHASEVESTAAEVDSFVEEIDSHIIQWHVEQSVISRTTTESAVEEEGRHCEKKTAEHPPGLWEGGFSLKQGVEEVVKLFIHSIRKATERGEEIHRLRCHRSSEDIELQDLR